MMKMLRLLLTFCALLSLSTAQAQLAGGLMFPGPGTPASSGATSVIKMIQAGTVTVASGAGSGTYTISPAITTLGNAIIIWNGETTNDTGGQDNRTAVILTLTNTSTLTATRVGTVAFVTTVSFTIVEFASGVNSIQAGNIAIAPTNTTNTATISTVGATAFVLYQGTNVSANTTANFPQGGVSLTNSTTVTATVPTSATITQTVRYMVVDLDSTVVSAVQQVANASTSTTTSDTDTITSVTPGNVSLMWGGISQLSLPTIASDCYNLFLTNGTTVTKTRSGTGAISRTVFYTVVTWATAALNGSVQRTSSALAISAATSATWTLGSSVSTAKSFVNYNGFSAIGTNASTLVPALTLSSTTVVASLNTSGTSTPTAEVVQFQ